VIHGEMDYRVPYEQGLQLFYRATSAKGALQALDLS